LKFDTTLLSNGHIDTLYLGEQNDAINPCVDGYSYDTIQYSKILPYNLWSGNNNYGSHGAKCVVLLAPNVMRIDTNYHTRKDSCWTEQVFNWYQYPERFAPTIDLVRVWVAPYKGIIDVSGEARLSEDFQDFRRASKITDGVGLAIQKSGEDSIRLFWHLTPNDSIHNMNVGGIDVEKGDKIFFRMNSVNKRDYDKVVWNPQIRYSTAYDLQNVEYSSTRLNDLDANGDSIFAFNYGKDYSLSQEQKIGAPFNSKFNVHAKLSSNGQPLKEDLVFTIKKGYEIKDSIHYKFNSGSLCIGSEKEGSNVSITNNSIVIDTFVFPASSILNVSLDTLIDMNNSFSIFSDVDLDGSYDWWFDWTDCFEAKLIKQKGRENIFFELGSGNGGQQKWTDINADVSVTIAESNDTVNFKNGSLFQIDSTGGNNDTVYNFVYHPSVNKITYDYLSIPGQAFIPSSDIKGFKIKTQGSIPITFKDESGIIIPQSTLANTYVYTDTLRQGHKYYLDYYYGGTTINTADLCYSNDIKIATINAGVYTNYDTSYNKFGTMYRNWGQFGYRGNDGTDNKYIDESLLYLNSKLSSMDSSSLSGSSVTLSSNSPTATASNGNVYNPLLDHFFFMNVDLDHNCWTGYGNIIYAAKDYIGLTKVSTANDTVIDRTLSPIPAAVPGSRIVAINKHTYTDGFAQTGSIGVPGVGLSLGVNGSEGTTRVLGDFMDMNGDRFPDVISEKQIQYTKQRGGLSNIIRWNNGIVDSSEYTATGENFGATFLQPKFQLGNDPKKSKTIVEGAFGASVAGSNSTNTTASTLQDINGDGLPDKIYQNGIVMFNNGYGWEEGRYGGNLGDIRKSFSESFSASLNGSLSQNFNSGNTSISGGLGYSYSDNTTTYTLSDINGDGMPDVINNNVVTFNKGNGFAQSRPLGVEFDKSKTSNIDASLAFTVGFTIGPWPVKLDINPKGGMAWSATTTENQWIDMNNDGYPDYMYKEGGDIKVRYSQIGKTNLLKRVTTILGSEYQIDYTLSNSSKDCPQRYWNMSSLKVYDGFSGDGVDTMKTTF